MATHSSTLAWRIPGQEALQSVGPQESDITQRAHTPGDQGEKFTGKQDSRLSGTRMWLLSQRKRRQGTPWEPRFARRT